MSWSEAACRLCYSLWRAFHSFYHYGSYRQCDSQLEVIWILIWAELNRASQYLMNFFEDWVCIVHLGYFSSSLSNVLALHCSSTPQFLPQFLIYHNTWYYTMNSKGNFGTIFRMQIEPWTTSPESQLHSECQPMRWIKSLS